MRKSFNIFLISMLVFSLFAGINLEPAKAEDITDLWTWYDGDFNYRAFVTVNTDRYIDTNIENYPVYLNLNDQNSAYWDYYNSGDPSDILIVGLVSNVATPLDYEIINYNASTHDLEIFFNAPLLKGASGISSSNYETFALYYDYSGAGAPFDNPEDVWVNGLGIYHLINDGNDSSSNNNHFTTIDATLIENSNYYGNHGYLFNGTDEGMTTNAFNYGALANVTILTEFNADSNTSTRRWLFKEQCFYSDTFISSYNLNGFGIYIDSEYKMIYDFTGLNTNTFYNYATTYNGTSSKIYVNGSNRASENYSGSISAISTALKVGSNYPYDVFYSGSIGYLWIFEDLKSADWIKAHYENLTDYSNFITLSSGHVDQTPIITSPTNASLLDSNPDFNWSFLDDFTYNLQIGIYPGFSGLSYDQTIGEETIVTTLTNHKTYYARTRGYNTIEHYYTDWSDPINFKLGKPPIIVSPETDDIITNNLNVEFSWDNLYTGYIWWQVDISKDNFTTSEYNTSIIYAFPTVLLDNNSTYYYRVRGYNYQTAYYTNWSDTSIFTTDLKPSITFPTPDWVITSSLDVNFTWSDLGTVSGHDFLWYLEVSNNSSFTDIEDTYNDYATSAVLTLPEGSYYARVRGYETTDLYYSNWSDTIPFSIDLDICDENLLFTYPTYNATFPTNEASIIWNNVTNASTYDIRFSTSPTMAIYTTYTIPNNYLNLTLDEGTYYIDVRVKYNDDTYSNWYSDCIGQYYKFNVVISTIDVPTWILPSTSYVEEGLITFSWSEDTNADYYTIQFYDNPTFDPDDLDDPSLIDQRVPTTNSIQLTLESGLYWIVVRTHIDDDYSAWSLTKQLTVTTDGEIPTFDPTDVPTWITPTDTYLESGNIYYSWSAIGGASGYDIQISTSSTFSSFIVNTSTSNAYYTANLDTSDVYYTRVRAKDPYYNGAWSLTKHFELIIEEAEYIYTVNTVNLYGGDILLYEFTDLEPFTTYTFKINSLTDEGQFFQNITTKIVNSNGDGEGSFTYTFSNSAFYPFEVRDNDINYRLLTHFVAPRPSYLYTVADHRSEYNGSVISVGAGNVVYNNVSGLLHDPYQPTQCLYEYGDYILVHYSIPDPEDQIYGIVIKNLYTGATVGIMSSDDLYNFNKGLGYAKRNFVVISTNGEKPLFIDSWNELLSYTGDNWDNFVMESGAYDYALLELGGEDYAIGESVILIGDEAVEWALTANSATVTEGSNQTWTFTVNTPEIWDSYNYMYFLDKSSGTFKIGSASAYEKYPFSYQSTFNIQYPVTTESYDDGAGRWGIRPSKYNFNEDLSGVYYEYIIEKSFIITLLTDATTAIDDFLVLVGLGTVTGKLLVSIGITLGTVIAVALLGIPVAISALVGLGMFVIFVALGFIPVWTIIIIGIALILLLLRTFLSGGGGNGGE